MHDRDDSTPTERRPEIEIRDTLRLLCIRCSMVIAVCLGALIGVWSVSS